MSARIADSAAAGHEPDHAPAPGAPPVVAPSDQPATARPAASSSQPDRLLHVGGMMPPGIRVYQPVADVARMPSPISVAITSEFMPIQTCRQQQECGPPTPIWPPRSMPSSLLTPHPARARSKHAGSPSLRPAR